MSGPKHPQSRPMTPKAPKMDQTAPKMTTQGSKNDPARVPKRCPGVPGETPSTPKRTKDSYRESSIRLVRGDRFEDQHRSEIDQKTEPRWKCVLSPILVDFGSICGGFWKLKLTRNRFEKPSKKRPRTKKGPRRPKGRFWVDEGDRPLPFWTPGR